MRFLTRARPGLWFRRYHDDWDAAHPGAWANGTGACGGFCAGNVWVTGTPDWDREWFRAAGMKMPWRTRVADMGAKPGEYRIASVLYPGESVSATIDVQTGEVHNHGVHGGKG